MNRKLVQPALLVLVFLGPLVLAVIVFYGPSEWMPRSMHGELIEPPVPLPREVLAPLEQARDAGARDAWLLLYARSSACREQCTEHLMRLHQVRLALAEDRRRVQIALFVPGARVASPPGALRLAARPDEESGTALAELLGPERIRDGRVFVADPLGNLVIGFEPDAPQRGMLEDLERLLGLGLIG